MTPAEPQAIKARLERATPGPWDVYDFGVYSTTKINPLGEPTNICGDVTWEDAELIAHAPTDIAMLLGENEKLRKVAEAARRYMRPQDYIKKEELTAWQIWSMGDELQKALAELEGKK